MNPCRGLEIGIGFIPGLELANAFGVLNLWSMLTLLRLPRMIGPFPVETLS